MRLACPEGLEPPTYSLEGYCSIQLSYGQIDVGQLCYLACGVSATAWCRAPIIPVLAIAPRGAGSSISGPGMAMRL